ncbi:hypothetical protein TNCV_2839171 [Trichonephila clavipes]|nr:hypothetical protein TNCV_2839171 [Trichonephila clavipes]
MDPRECHLHEDQAQNALDRPVVERRPPHRMKCTRTANCFIGWPSRHSGAVLEETRISEKWNQVIFSDESRFTLSSDENCVHVWKPVVNASILPLLYSDRPLSQSWCDSMGCHCQQYTVNPSIDPWHHDSPAVCP